MSLAKLRYQRIIKLARLSTNYIHEFGLWHFINTALYELKRNGRQVFAPETSEQSKNAYSQSASYKYWLIRHRINEESRSKIIQKLNEYSIKPKIIIVLSVSEKNVSFINRTVQSIMNQMYDNWIVHILCQEKILGEINSVISVQDSRIIINSESRQTFPVNNIEIFTSDDYVTFFNSGDVLTDDALFRIVQIINKNQNVDLIYSDEDKIDKDDNRTEPFFKPDWSPDLFLSFDYISNFYVTKKSLFSKLEKFKEGFESSTHYEFLLRATEVTENIIHIPTVLISVFGDQEKQYDRTKSSLATEALDSLSETLARRGIKGKIIRGMFSNTFRIKYILDEEPKVSIIIPTKDQKHLLQRCITNIERKTSYKNYEIIIVDNNSTKEETISYLKSLPYTVIKYNSSFNFSKINNIASGNASGDYLLFLNDDTAPLESNWLSEMVSNCQQKNIGIVGSKLVLHDNTVQHAGLVFLKTGAGFHPLQGIDSDSGGYFHTLNVVRNFSAVTGACLLINRKIFDQIGGFDEEFDLYYGDADLCLKVLKHGYRVVYTPYAKLLHQGSSSIKEQTRSFFAVENHYAFIKKWPYLKNGDPFYNPNLTWDYRIDEKYNYTIE